jgi:hypothetical protein
MICEVINTETEAPPVLPEVHTLLDGQIQFKIIRKGVSVPGLAACLILEYGAKQCGAGFAVPA